MMSGPTLDIAINRSGMPIFTLPMVSPLQSKIYGGVLSKRKTWIYPAFYPYHSRVVRDARKIFPELILTERAQKHISQEDTVPEKMSEEDIDGYVPVTPFYPHQRRAFCEILWNLRYGLFLGRGLGKTKVIIDLIRHLKRSDPSTMCLVLALRVNLETWKEETLLHSGGEIRAEALVAGDPASRERALDRILEDRPDILVCTYDTARVATDIIKEKVPYTVIVADESHRLRGYKSKQTRAAHSLAGKATRRILLTGTASLGDPRHLWGQLRFLGKFIVPKYWTFQERHTVKSPRNEHIVVSFKNMHLLNEQVSGLALSLEAEDCLELPPRSFQHVSVAPTPTMIRAYNSLANGRNLLISGHMIRADERIVALGKLAQISSGFVYVSLKNPDLCDGCPHLQECVRNSVKPYTSGCHVDKKDPGNIVVDLRGGNPVLDAVGELLEGHLAENRKVIIWAKHVAMLDKLNEHCGKVLSKNGGGNIVRFDSTTKNPKEAENAFNKDPECKVLIGQISMGIAITLKAPAMIYAEIDWRLDHWLQSLDRNFGIRAKGFKQLIVQTVAVRGSVMDATRKLLSRKIDVAAMVTKSPECISCDRSIECLARGVRPYDPECKYDKTTSKVTVTTPEIG